MTLADIRRHERRIAGLCSRCGKAPAESGRRTCARCGAKPIPRAGAGDWHDRSNGAAVSPARGRFSGGES